jgi:hypothetical protein
MVRALKVGHRRDRNSANIQHHRTRAQPASSGAPTPPSASMRSSSDRSVGNNGLFVRSFWIAIWSWCAQVRLRLRPELREVRARAGIAGLCAGGVVFRAQAEALWT